MAEEDSKDLEALFDQVLQSNQVEDVGLGPLKDEIIGLRARWDLLFDNKMSVDDFKILAKDTQDFFIRHS